MGLRLPNQGRQAIVAHAHFCLPNEACGLLAVDHNGLIRMVYSLDNSESSPDRFTIEHRQHFGAMLHAERSGWEMGGVFHSHPSGGAVLSGTDLAQPHDPTWVHVVVGFVPHLDLRAWRIVAGTAREVTID